MPDKPMTVLYSFPQKLGADRVCYTAWQQVRGVARAGADVLVHTGVVQRPVPGAAETKTTLSIGRARVSYRALGMRRACALHDWVVAGRLDELADRVDVIHCWPLGSLRTLERAAELGVPTFLERPNVRTEADFAAVQAESERLGIPAAAGSEHSYDQAVLDREEREYALAHRLLCPSEFVARSFLDQGYPPERLARHTYGYDPERFHPARGRDEGRPFTVLFAGFAAVRKGLHTALDAWLRSPASETGRFLIAGGFMPKYREYLADRLAHPSVRVLGQRDDVAELMRHSDALVLPSVAEGFGLVCAEAMASGCVPLVSDVVTEQCVHDESALRHPLGDTETLAAHLSLLASDRGTRERLRRGAIAAAGSLTWDAAGERLLAAYQSAATSGAGADR